jgi:hyperosmotically inducible periplasmic protein
MARSIRGAMTATGLAFICVWSIAAQTPSPDNTKVNARDRQSGAKTAQQQSTSKEDVDITRRIRQVIVADDKLSTNAHNVKIITRAGKVTLKGPVKTAEEKKAVEAKARDVAGSANVTSQLSITNASSSSTPSPTKSSTRQGKKGQ